MQHFPRSGIHHEGGVWRRLHITYPGPAKDQRDCPEK
jgi:hypothetical protein